MKQETYICNSDQCEPYFTKGKEYKKDENSSDFILRDNNKELHPVLAWKDRFTIKSEIVIETDLDKAERDLNEKYKVFIDASKRYLELITKKQYEDENTL